MAQTAFFKAILKFCTTNKIFVLIVCKLFNRSYTIMIKVTRLNYLTFFWEEPISKSGDPCDLVEK